jgi:hypothetical protein
MTTEQILLQTYWLSKAINHNLFFLKQYKNKINDESLIDSINQLSAKSSYFNAKIENALGEKMSKKFLEQQEEFTYELLEHLENKLNNENTKNQK